MDPRAPAGQQMSSQPLSGDWSSGPVQTQQGPDRPPQQATQASPGTLRLKTPLVFTTANRQGPQKNPIHRHTCFLWRKLPAIANVPAAAVSAVISAVFKLSVKPNTGSVRLRPTA